MSLPPESLRQLASYGLLRLFLRQELTLEAVKGQSLTSEQRQAAFQSFAQQRSLDAQEKLQRYCCDHLLTPEALAQQVELPLLIQQHCERYYLPKAEARFLERKHELDQVVYSLIRLTSEGLARELFLQLQDGEAGFADLASLYSEGPEKATRGVVGPVPLNQGHPQLVQRLQASKIGVLQEPFQIEQWWLIVRLEWFRPATFDDSMALQMSKELFDQWLEVQLNQRIEELRLALAYDSTMFQP